MKLLSRITKFLAKKKVGNSHRDRCIPDLGNSAWPKYHRDRTISIQSTEQTCFIMQNMGNLVFEILDLVKRNLVYGRFSISLISRKNLVSEGILKKFRILLCPSQ